MATIYDTLKKLGIEDAKELPKKTQMKLADYNRITKTPIGKDKEGNLREQTRLRLESLIEDIVVEAKLYLKKKAKGDDGEGQTQSLAQAQQNNAQTENKTQNAQSRQKPSDPPAEEKGFLENILGW
jgi:hypothetical protein